MDSKFSIYSFDDQIEEEIEEEKTSEQGELQDEPLIEEGVQGSPTLPTGSYGSE